MVEERVVLDSTPTIEVGDALDFHTHTLTVDELHQSLLSFWKPRWRHAEQMDGVTWRGLTNFVQQFMPRIPLTLPPLTIEDGKRSVRRFRPTAARGADGWAKLDLLHLPQAHTTKLLELLTAIENGQAEWPAQLLEGLVIAIGNCDGAHKPKEFRPIVLLSIIYRCWASLR